ncbi:MAG: hypothetical protein Q8L64_01575 [bacterium]|nr:hypothetical protein [bacterium]
MSRKPNILRVFVASPSDVKKDGERIKSIIDDVNKEIGSSSGTQLEFVSDKTDVPPGIGEYPQDVINKKINDEYEVFIGIMGKIFGTPTKVALSGTAEEFERAFTRHTVSPGSVSIMFYFKKANINPDEINLEQTKLIREFRKNLGEKKGALWDEYKTMREFDRKIRLHLHDAVRTSQKAKKARVKPVNRKAKSNVVLKNLPSWELLFEHDDNGDPIEGSIKLLIEAVASGCPIRIRVHHQNGVIQVMDAPLLSVEKGVVHASDIDQISKTRDKSGNYVYQDKLYHYYIIANSRGDFHAKRIYLEDGKEHYTNNSKKHMAWIGLVSSSK